MFNDSEQPSGLLAANLKVNARAPQVDEFTSVLRDHEVDPERSGAGVVMFMSRACDALLDGEDVIGYRSQILRATVGHAVHFYTWRPLVKKEGLSKGEAVNMICELILSGWTV